MRNASTLHDHLRVLRRRKWTVLQAVVLVTTAAALVSLQQQRLYEASAEVLLNRQNLAATLTGTQDPYAGQSPDRIAQTQADLARVPAVANAALDASGLTGRTPTDLLDVSSVSAKRNADLLEFSVRDPQAAAASRLATEYATAFTRYRRQLDTAALSGARKEVQARLRRLRANGDKRAPLYASLVNKVQQLRTMEALQTSNTSVVREAGEAQQVQPKPVRNAALGVLLGLMLGIGFALLREAVDTRIRSGEEIGHMLGLPLLARLPRPAKRLRDEHRPVMLADTGGAEAEAYRVLRTNFELVNLERRARTIMITSSVQGEGKSTTTANLGIALARAGRRVLLIDLDLRDPYLARFFDLEDGPGLTDVALGHVDLEQAIARIALAASGGAVTGSGNGAGRIEGVLEVLPLGPVPPNPGEFTGGRTLAGHLDALRDRADVVLVDSAPMLHVGDALALSALVDALIVVTRVDIVRRPMLVELRRAIDASPAGKLGFVLTGADLEAGYGRGDYRYKEKTYGRRPLDRDRESVS